MTAALPPQPDADLLAGQSTGDENGFAVAPGDATPVVGEALDPKRFDGGSGFLVHALRRLA